MLSMLPMPQCHNLTLYSIKYADPLYAAYAVVPQPNPYSTKHADPLFMLPMPQCHNLTLYSIKYADPLYAAHTAVLQPKPLFN